MAIRSRTSKLKLLVLTLGFGLLSYEIYSAIYPSESFYRAEFEKVAGTLLPDSARFVFGEASFPDQFSDYSACALFEVNRADYGRLSRHMESQGRQRLTQELHADCLRHLIEVYGRPLEFALEVREQDGGGEYRRWGLLNDGQTVVLHYAGW